MDGKGKVIEFDFIEDDRFPHWGTLKEWEYKLKQKLKTESRVIITHEGSERKLHFSGDEPGWQKRKTYCLRKSGIGKITYNDIFVIVNSVHVVRFIVK